MLFSALVKHYPEQWQWPLSLCTSSTNSNVQCCALALINAMFMKSSEEQKKKLADSIQAKSFRNTISTVSIISTCTPVSLHYICISTCTPVSLLVPLYLYLYPCISTLYLYLYLYPCISTLYLYLYLYPCISTCTSVSLLVPLYLYIISVSLHYICISTLITECFKNLKL